MTDSSKPTTPPALASQLFEMALAQCKGNPRDASMQVIRFLTDALLFSISVSSSDNEIVRTSLLKQVGESIIAAPPHPLTVTPAGKP